MGAATALAVGAAAVAAGSAISAASKKNPSFNYQQSSLGSQAEGLASTGLFNYNQAAGAGGAFQQGQQALTSYAQQLQQYSQGGFMPGQADISAANDLSGQIFAPQRVQLQQAFEQQLVNANRAAAVSGRDSNDPILRAKLGQSQMQQGAVLDAQQGSFAAQYAQSIPQQRIQYAGQAANQYAQVGQNALNQASSQATLGNSIASGQSNQQMNLAKADYQQQQDSTNFGQRFGSVLTSTGGMLGATSSMFGSSAPQTGGGGQMFNAGSGAQGYGNASYDPWATQSSANQFLGGGGYGSMNPYMSGYGGQSSGVSTFNVDSYLK